MCCFGHTLLRISYMIVEWVSVCLQVQFKTPLITFKALNGSGPYYLWNCLYPRASAHHTRSERIGAFSLPNSVTDETKEIFLHYHDVCLWNRISLRSGRPILLAFEKATKIWLFPQVLGCDVCRVNRGVVVLVKCYDASDTMIFIWYRCTYLAEVKWPAWGNELKTYLCCLEFHNGK